MKNKHYTCQGNFYTEIRFFANTIIFLRSLLQPKIYYQVILNKQQSLTPLNVSSYAVKDIGKSREVVPLPK